MNNIESQTYPQGTRTSTTAILSLIAGILAWLGIFGLGGILAIIFGYVAKKEIRNSHGSISGDGLATAGLVLGYTNIALSLAGFCIAMMILLGLLSAPALCLPFFNDLNTVISTAP